MNKDQINYTYETETEEPPRNGQKENPFVTSYLAPLIVMASTFASKKIMLCIEKYDGTYTYSCSYYFLRYTFFAPGPFCSIC